MKYIVNFSGGLCSFFSAVRTVKNVGRENTVLLFADTLYENPDLYEFNCHAEKLLNLPLTRICVGLTPWELFRREGLIGNDRFPICSTKLKREPLNSWMEAHYQMDIYQPHFFKESATVILGFDFTEYHRVSDFQNQHPSWTVLAPMIEGPLWDKCRMIEEAAALGFKTPELYALGFPHNNCGGGCVKAGISHFVHLYQVKPDTFKRWEAEEQFTLSEFARRGVSSGHFTILKDRRGGETKPLSLQALRLRIEAGEKFPADEWGGCGCGGVATDNVGLLV